MIYAYAINLEESDLGTWFAEVVQIDEGNDQPEGIPAGLRAGRTAASSPEAALRALADKIEQFARWDREEDEETNEECTGDIGDRADEAYALLHDDAYSAAKGITDQGGIP